MGDGVSDNCGGMAEYPVSQVSEAWRAVRGYEGRYEVSSHGRVRSLGIEVNAKGGARAFRPGRVMAPATKSNGYRQVTLVAVDGSRKSGLLHQLVCEAFVGPRPLGMQVRHWNGDVADSDAVNLVWGTKSDNERDKQRHGTFVSYLPHLRCVAT